MYQPTYLTIFHNSSWSRCALAAAFSASSKTKVLSDSTSLGPDHGEKTIKNKSFYLTKFKFSETIWEVHALQWAMNIAYETLSS